MLNAQHLGIALLVALACAAGCGARQSGSACEFPAEGIRIAIVPGSPMNPGPDGTSLPTNVRLYQLSGPSSLGETSAESVWQDAATTFGPALLATTEVTVYPDEPIEQVLQPAPGAQSLVAVALVRRPVGDSWFAEVPLAAVRDRLCTDGDAANEPAVRFQVHDHGISLQAANADGAGAP